MTKLFREYETVHPDDYLETAFKLAIHQHHSHTSVIGYVENYTANQTNIDFTGDKLEVIDEMTNKTKKAEVFIAILPFSN